RQAGAFQSHRHQLLGFLMSANPAGGGLYGLNTGAGSGSSATYIGDSGGPETRPMNIAYHPRIHV
ncbi:phage tail protein, partial [Achromobacter xylosoxidans]